ncbi:MAG: hypothetical protein H7A36_06500 [Chlamydiales bacterium]|nr:hypothetical protein [Chlamydiales bacterium]
MFRIAFILVLCFSTCFAKQKVETLPCGCPVDHNMCEDPKEGRTMPAPLAGLAASMKRLPGLWTVLAVGVVVAGVAVIVADDNSVTSHS